MNRPPDILASTQPASTETGRLESQGWISALDLKGVADGDE
jgi:hypothetical protein